MKESFLRGGRYYTDLRTAGASTVWAPPADLDAWLGLVTTGNADADADDGSETDQAGDDGICGQHTLGLLPDCGSRLHLIIVSFLFCL